MHVFYVLSIHYAQFFTLFDKYAISRKSITWDSTRIFIDQLALTVVAIIAAVITILKYISRNYASIREAVDRISEANVKISTQHEAYSQLVSKASDGGITLRVEITNPEVLQSDRATVADNRDS